MQAKSYRTVAAPAQDEFTEKKSRFIGFIAPVTTEQEAAEFVEEIRGLDVLSMTPMDALNSAADFCDRCIHETVKRQPWHWYGLAFEPVLKGNHV